MSVNFGFCFTAASCPTAGDNHSSLRVWGYAVCVRAVAPKSNCFDRAMEKSGCSNLGTNLTFETDLLETTIRKIAGLLQVGFGDAGAAIIAQNIKVRGHAVPSVL